MNIIERFLKYVSFDTQSKTDSNTYPSTLKQLDLLNFLLKKHMINKIKVLWQHIFGQKS